MSHSEALFIKAQPSSDTPNFAGSLTEMATERDPLLPATDTSLRTQDQSRSPVGPLEISQSTRYTILAGIWSATFLSVCVFLGMHLDVFDETLRRLIGSQQYVPILFVRGPF